MASIKINTNITQVTADIRSRIDLLKNAEYLLRPVCFDLIDLMTKRIHIDGKAADDQPIGKYNPVYLKLRQKKYQRSSENKVIVSLTRQLENDWTVIATPNGYAIGFHNSFNLQKMRWVEAIKQKDIASLSPSETEYAVDLINELTNKALND